MNYIALPSFYSSAMGSGLLNYDQYSGIGLDFRPDISFPIR